MNGSPSIGSLLSFSWAKTKELLFPFNFKRWIRILFIVWLSGQAAGLGGGNMPGRRPTAPPPQEEQTQPVQSTAQVGQTQVAEGEEPQTNTTVTQEPADIQEGTETEAETPERPPLNPAVIVALILVMIPIILFFSWLSARFNFILLDLLVNRDVKIRESFRAHKAIGNSYFLWSLAFGLIAIGTFVVVALTMALAATGAKVLLWLLIPLFVLLILALVIAGVALIDFVVPIMYRDGIKTMDACKKFLSFKPSWGRIAIYILLKMGLGIAAAIIAFVAVLVIGLAFLIAALVIGIPAGLIAAALPFLKPVFIGLGIVDLMAGILALIVLVGLVTLPIPIFFRAFALSYLFKLFPDYNLLGFASSASSS